MTEFIYAIGAAIAAFIGYVASQSTAQKANDLTERWMRVTEVLNSEVLV